MRLNKMSRYSSWLAGIVVCAVSLSAHSASSVSSMKLVKVGGDRFWQVTATCDDDKKYKLRRPERSKTWCSIDKPEVCDNNKQTVARLICKGEVAATSVEEKVEKAEKVEPKPTPKAPKNTSSASNSKVVAPAVDREKLLEEQMKVEEKRIQLQQKRLELQRRELELKKRQSGV